MTINRYALICILILATAFSGCASQGVRSGFLDNYDNLKSGSHLEGFHVNSDLIGKYAAKKILIGAIDTSRVHDKKNITVEHARKRFLSSLQNHIYKYQLGDHIFLDSAVQTPELELQIALTEMNPGSAGGRMFAGEFGMGHAYVQVEGKIFNKNTNEVLVTLSERRRSSGAIGLADLAGDSGPDLVVEMLDGIADDIVRELFETFNFTG